MTSKTFVLTAGSSFEDLVDGFEGAVVAYMAQRRNMTEAQFRALLWSAKPQHRPVLESYNRKMARHLCMAASQGLTPAAALSSIRHNRNSGYSTSPDAGPQLPQAKKA